MKAGTNTDWHNILNKELWDQERTCHGDTDGLLHTCKSHHQLHTHQSLAHDETVYGRILVCFGSVSAQQISLHTITTTICKIIIQD